MRAVTLLLLFACAGDKAPSDSKGPVVQDDTSGPSPDDSAENTDPDSAADSATDSHGDSAADSHGDSATDTAGGALSVRLSGAAAKGPMIRGSSVDVAPLDATGAPTGAVFSTYTDDDAGRFSLEISLTGPARLEAKGYYYNEATGALSLAPIKLRSYHTFSSSGDASATINLFTHLCSGRIEALIADGAALDDAIDTAEAEAVAALSIAPSTFDPGVAGASMDLLGGDSDGNAWLFGLSVVLTQRALDEVGPDGPVDATLSETINSLSDDLADGVLDGSAIVPTGDELYATQATIDAETVMTRLAARFEAIGSDAVVPDLHRVFDLDLDGIVDLDDPDADGDGYDRVSDGGEDCDDYDNATWPGAPEDHSDGLDSDCTVDTDGDGVLSSEDGGSDCDDDDPATWPGAAEVWYDGVDQACDGDNDGDQDGDGEDASAWGGDDCDDTDAAIHPAATESCATAADDDCDGDDNDPGATGCADWYIDEDADGFGGADIQCTCEAASPYTATEYQDCDDTDAASGPGGAEVWYDGVDQACDGDNDGDQDGDGEDATAWGGADCDDTDAAIHPSAAESCATTADDDCDGDTNDIDAAGCSDWYLDVDTDGFGRTTSQCTCAATGLYTATGADDCDDTNAAISPGASEQCNETDDDCDGSVDEAGARGETTWYHDGDGDGDGDAASTVSACDRPTGYVAGDDDCDDTNASIHPSATESCATAEDDDCDGDDNDVGATGCSDWNIDADEDGFGGDDVQCTCVASAPYTATDAEDCDDADALAWPGADEVWYDGIDQACDGDDDGDQDGDGWDAVAWGGADCDDEDTTVHPSATESCATAADDDCDGDDNDVGATGCSVWYFDLDEDGYGRTATQCTCEATGLYTATRGGDCDDLDDEISPAGAEQCNDADDDCDGSVDESGASGELTWYRDSDGDGEGSAGSTALGCDAPTGYVASDDDCDDSDATRYTAADEICENSIDEDCDGTKDEYCPSSSVYSVVVVPAGTSSSEITRIALACSVSAIVSGIPGSMSGMGFTTADLPVKVSETNTTYWVCTTTTVGGVEVEDCEAYGTMSKTWEHATCAAP